MRKKAAKPGNPNLKRECYTKVRLQMCSQKKERKKGC